MVSIFFKKKIHIFFLKIELCCYTSTIYWIVLFYQDVGYFFFKFTSFLNKKIIFKNIDICSHANLRFGPESDINSV
jgi:hypothetical protein